MTTMAMTTTDAARAQPVGRPDDADCWSAVTRRDHDADGSFVYSVRSTGVYCRPSCPGRLPRRENVRFHADCAAAEAAGFRACKRCRPQIDTGLRYAIAGCSLGTVLLAAGLEGVCAVLLGDDPAALVRDLRDRFPRRGLRRDDPGLAPWLARMREAIDAPGRPVDLPLAPEGSPFQRRVWQALRQVPPGETTSYAALAASLGAPTATRAVARACAANPIAVAIPCHRVLRRDGGLSGYRWGVARKAALLAREAGG